MSIAAAYWSIFVTGLMPNNLFNNWCIHESSTVYLKLLRYKLVTMFKEKKNKNKVWSFAMMLLEKEDSILVVYENIFFCVLVRRENSVTHLYAAIQRIAWRPPINSLGHFRWPTVKVKRVHVFFHTWRFQHCKVLPYKTFFAATV